MNTPDSPDSLNTLLVLPFAKQVLAFEEQSLNTTRVMYDGIYPYVRMGGEGYVLWALDCIEHLLEQPHDAELDEALMRLAVHVGEPASNIRSLEIRDDLRWLCAHLHLTPPKGMEAMKLSILGLLEDWACGLIPQEREGELLTYLHHQVWRSNCEEALGALSDFYWELERIDDLSLLRLAGDLPSREDVRRRFCAYARVLLDHMALRLEPQDGCYHLHVQVPPHPPVH